MDPGMMLYSWCFAEEGEAFAVRGRGAGETNEEREASGAPTSATGEYQITLRHH